MKFRRREKKKILLNSGSAIWSFIYLFIFLLKYGFHYHLQNFDEIIMLKYG